MYFMCKLNKKHQIQKIRKSFSFFFTQLLLQTEKEDSFRWVVLLFFLSRKYIQIYFNSFSWTFQQQKNNKILIFQSVSPTNLIYIVVNENKKPYNSMFIYYYETIYIYLSFSFLIYIYIVKLMQLRVVLRVTRELSLSIPQKLYQRQLDLSLRNCEFFRNYSWLLVFFLQFYIEKIEIFIHIYKKSK